MSKPSIRDMSLISTANQVVLNEMRLIIDQDCELLQAHRMAYKAFNLQEGNVLERCYLSLYTSIVLQKRIVFGLSRNALIELIKSDKNFNPEQSGFQYSKWSFILQSFYNDFKLFKLVKQGQGQSVSIFEIVNPELLEYLEPLVDKTKQLEQSLAFSANIVRQRR